MPGLELLSVSKIYSGGVRAVDRVSLSVTSGELLVLVGPSGCGKSSLLRMVAGLEEVSEGEIRIGDRVVNDLPPRERDVAMVFQNYALYPHMTVFENMAFGLTLRKRPKQEIERTVRETASALGLEVKLSRKPRELSGGERQRVALGRALVRHPQVFLFDEPLSNLDAKLRVQTRGEIHRLHRRLEATMVYVTHDQVEAMTLGERIAVLKDGVLQQLAGPDVLYHQPANQFVAGFLGSPPMNFLTITLGVDGRPASGWPGGARGQARGPDPARERAWRLVRGAARGPRAPGQRGAALLEHRVGAVDLARRRRGGTWPGREGPAPLSFREAPLVRPRRRRGDRVTLASCLDAGPCPK